MVKGKGEYAMAESMLREEIDVYSNKFDIHGKVRDYGVVTKLLFTYEGKDIEIGITRNPLLGEKFEDTGRYVMETYISELARTKKERKLMLHYWYVAECEEEGEKYLLAHGRVSGHKHLPDSDYIHTSAIQSVSIDDKAGEAVIRTENSIYHCPLEYCNFKKQEKFPDLLPAFQNVKEKYGKGYPCPTIEPGKILLVLANFSDYYFHSICYIPEDGETKEPLAYSSYPHVGMFQDSFLIEVEGTGIDLRYFPHFQNIEFYVDLTEDKPLFIGDVGDIVLYAKTGVGTIKLEPGQRKEVKKENTEDKPPCLPRGDLYPAGIME